MKLIASLLVLLSPFYQFTQLNYLLPFSLPFRFYFYDFFLFIYLLPQLFSWFKRPPTKSPIFKPLAIFLSLAFLSLPISLLFSSLTLIQLPSAFLYFLRFSALMVLVFTCFTPQQQKIFSLILITFPFIGLLQYLLLPDLRFFKSIGFDDHYYRLTFPFLDPNYTGAALAFIFLSRLKSLTHKSSWPFLVVTFVALLLTFSRASYLALFVGLVYLFLTTPHLRKFFLPFLALFVVALFLIPKPFGEGVNLLRTFSITSRLDNYRHGLQLARQNPLTGLGFNTLSLHQNAGLGILSRSSGGLDNSFLFVLSTTGLLGLSAYIYFLFSFFRSLADPYLQAGLIALIAHSFFNNSLFYIPLLLLLIFSYLSILHTGRSS